MSLVKRNNPIETRRAFPLTSLAADVACAALAAVICVAIGWHTLGLGLLRLDAPALYIGDALQYQYIYESLRENGWFGEITRAGAPFTTTHFDFPNADAFNLFCIQVLGWVWDDPFVLYNAFILLSFVLCSITSYFVFRRLGIDRAFAVAASITFTVLPFHFMRVGHLFYMMYFSAALAAWLALHVVWSEEKPKSGLGKRVFTVLVPAVLCGTTGVYFAFFSCLLVFTSGLVASMSAARLLPIGRASIIAAIIACATLAQLIPSVVHTRAEGTNAEVASRHPSESEIYGLKISNLFMPHRTHRLEAFSKFRATYDATAPLVNENDTSALGLVGALGVLLLLATPFLGTWARRVPAMLHRATGPMYMLLLFTTIGGFGSIFAYFISPQLRALNRASPFIAFLAILAATAMLQHLIRHLKSDVRHRRMAGLIVASIVSAVAVFDQTGRGGREEGSNWASFHAHFTAVFDSDRAFFTRLQDSVPAGSMVFQLPTATYPEAPPLTERFGSYDHFKGYLHARKLNWSFGAMKGRPEATWQALLSDFPFSERVRSLQALGFAGIYVDWLGVVDRSVLSSELAAGGLVETLASGDATKSFYALPSPAPDGGRARAVAPGIGWFPLERNGDGVAVWSKGSATLIIANTTVQGRPCTLDLNLHTIAANRLVELWWDGRMISSAILQPDQPSVVSARLPPFEGKGTLELRSPAPPVSPNNGDPRMLAFRLDLPSVPLCR